MDPGNRRAIYAAFAANAGIAVAKFIGWTLTGASSMLAEAGHSLADSANQGLLLWGGAAASRAPTPDHPFGFGRERYFWSFVVALVIFSFGAVFAVYEGVSKLFDPHPLENPWIAIGILLLAIVLEGFSLLTAVKQARPLKGDQSWWTFIHRSKNPELPVVLLEDLGALVGLVFALIGVSIASATGDPRFDSMGSIAIGALLAVIAVILATEMKSLLIGEAASSEDRLAIERAIAEAPGVRRLIHMRTQHTGPDQLLVAAKVEFDPLLAGSALTGEINGIEAEIRAAVPTAQMIYLEPDIYEEGHAADNDRGA